MQAYMRKRGCAGAQAHAEVHIHMRRLACLRRQHASAQARVGARAHTCTHAEAYTLARLCRRVRTHACLCRHAHTHVHLSRRAHTRKHT